MHPAISRGGLAVVTGAAAGIGFAIADRLAAEDMDIVLFDRDANALQAATSTLQARHQASRLCTVHGDVTNEVDQARLRDACTALGPVRILVNNAGIIAKAGPWESSDAWRRVIDVNFWSALQLQQLFVGPMLANPWPCAIVNVGSKEGITTPPGNAAFAVSKAAIRVLSEQLAHELRQSAGHVTAHLLIPGYTFTPMNFPDMAATTAKPDAPWSADEVAQRMVEGMSNGDFYIFCEDNEVSRELDQLRMQWSADDLILNRPALSRWHPAYRDAFAQHIASARRGA